ncbi:uncharacterized protein LOC123408285 [Hordeum vulgare subsp. vulgare]|uniref:Predicted protein n=1 Tax=Hordeum vulgare subsp. vulgare TaxID=112509 RepID=F2EAM6_HORVV|nr:uncharacterized protein LOC123408285 [Hordeum vulgare subsp. vulgare]BAK04398.1 predicted protein [Hordeum vulgare subsp. vulgare]BAK07015.1 predicted protein [Hordeum vulgare subsp. vulgare]BAK08011.1 predicted protein [Hordeum vulgare subsp. vulgare]BAK08219.1 predicted protein [Hordeum vulgare subsp. vulgare]
MAVMDQDGGSARAPAPAPAPMRLPSYSCSPGSVEATHDRKLSHSDSFWTPAESLRSSSASSSSPPLSSSSSFESIPLPDLDRQSSLSSTSSYASLYQVEAAADHDRSSSCAESMPATLPPAVQTMMVQGQPAGYDTKRLPSSMFRTQSTCPAQWSATSNDSLFSIQLENSGEIGPLYGVGDLYYDASGVFHRLSSAARLPAVPEMSTGNSGGSLCVRDDCAGCGSGTSMNKKSVRFATADGVAGTRSLPPALEETEASVAETGAAAEAGWCSCPSIWWPSCACRGCDCRWS